MQELVSIGIQTGVNEQGQGFCTVVATSQERDLLIGQLPPDTVRKMALDWLGAAEAAETDGIVYRLLSSKFGLPLEAVGAFISQMRDERDSDS